MNNEFYINFGPGGWTVRHEPEGYDSYEEALDAASRMAAKEERKYIIYKAVATVETEAPPVKVTKVEEANK